MSFILSGTISKKWSLRN